MSSILKVDTIQTAAGGTPTAADLGLNVSGSVLQVVQAVKTDPQTISGTAYTAISGLAPVITPISASSKILIHVTVHWGESSDTFPAWNLLRNGSGFIYGDAFGSGTQQNTFTQVQTQANVRDQYRQNNASFTYLDSPATTSPITYSLSVSPMRTLSKTVYINRHETHNDANRSNTVSTIILQEIAG